MQRAAGLPSGPISVHHFQRDALLLAQRIRNEDIALAGPAEEVAGACVKHASTKHRRKRARLLQVDIGVEDCDQTSIPERIDSMCRSTRAVRDVEGRGCVCQERYAGR